MTYINHNHINHTCFITIVKENVENYVKIDTLWCWKYPKFRLSYKNQTFQTLKSEFRLLLNIRTRVGGLPPITKTQNYGFEATIENKSCSTSWVDPKIAHWASKKPIMTPQLGQKQKLHLKEAQKQKFSVCWVDPKIVFRNT